jgi:hypothetical protein
MQEEEPLETACGPARTWGPAAGIRPLVSLDSVGGPPSSPGEDLRPAAYSARQRDQTRRLKSPSRYPLASFTPAQRNRSPPGAAVPPQYPVLPRSPAPTVRRDASLTRHPFPCRGGAGG